MRLILRLIQNDLNRADDRSRRVFSGEHHALAARHTRGRAAPERLRFGAGHRQHEADGCAAFHAVDQHVAQSLDLAITRWSADVESEWCPAPHLLDARERSVATITIYRAGLRVRLRNAVGSLSCMARQSPSERRYVSAAERHLDTSLLHPDLLMNAPVARASFVSHSRAGRQDDLDDLDGRGKVGREKYCAARSRTADRATACDRRAATPGWPVRSNRRTASPAARRVPRRFSPTPLQWGCFRHARPSEIIDRLTSHLRGERIEGHTEVRPQRPDAARDARVDVLSDGPLLHPA